MSPFVEGREGNAISSSPLSNDSFEEAEKHNYLRNSMIWINDSYERAKSEAKRLRSQYGESMPAEEIMQSLSDDEYRRLYDSLMPWNKEETNSATSLRYHLFAVIMHHGSAYSGHYSAYIRDCLSEGTWKAPSTSSSMSRKDNSVSSEQLPKGICHIIPRPGEILVLESSPLNIVLSIVHSSCDESNITPTRNNRQSAIVVNDNRPCIQVLSPSFLPHLA